MADSDNLKNAVAGLMLQKHIAAGTFGVQRTPPPAAHDPVMNARLGGSGVYTPLFAVNFNGEKNVGEIGPIKDYRIDYASLRARSWQLYLDSEIAQTVIGKYVTWVIGKGLKLQAEPEKTLLESEGIDIDVQKFCSRVESRFKIWSESNQSDYSRMENLNLIEATAFKNAKVGGDTLVILRYINGTVTIQLIDGAHIISPIYGNEIFPKVLQNGNRIENGIELNERNEHIAYYVRKAVQGYLYSWETERIPARGESGMLMAFMVYGSKYRIDNHRGLPLLSVMFETAKKLERYKEAVVGSAEERSKIPYFIEHGIQSTGEDPMINQTAHMRDLSRGSGDVPITAESEELASKVAATTNKMVFNMPLDSTIKALEGKTELYFKDFYSVNIDLFCAAAEIPPNVAMSKYDSNFSASRAALKDWEHTLLVQRHNFKVQFMQPIYNFWLEVQILLGKISAPGYLDAVIKDNFMVADAYRTCRFVGSSVPHIDPVKEVDAERKKLGILADHLPLTTVEQATESLNGGDSDANMEQFADEFKDAEKLGLKMLIPPPPAPGGGSAPAKKPKKKKA